MLKKNLRYVYLAVLAVCVLNSFCIFSCDLYIGVCTAAGLYEGVKGKQWALQSYKSNRITGNTDHCI